jgi:hypothetical protein
MKRRTPSTLTSSLAESVTLPPRTTLSATMTVPTRERVRPRRGSWGCSACRRQGRRGRRGPLLTGAGLGGCRVRGPGGGRGPPPPPGRAGGLLRQVRGPGHRRRGAAAPEPGALRPGPGPGPDRLGGGPSAPVLFGHGGRRARRGPAAGPPGPDARRAVVTPAGSSCVAGMVAERGARLAPSCRWGGPCAEAQAAVRRLRRPGTAWALHVGALWLWHSAALYEAALGSHWLQGSSTSASSRQRCCSGRSSSVRHRARGPSPAWPCCCCSPWRCKASRSRRCSRSRRRPGTSPTANAPKHGLGPAGRPAARWSDDVGPGRSRLRGHRPPAGYGRDQAQRGVAAERQLRTPTDRSFTSSWPCWSPSPWWGCNVAVLTDRRGTVGSPGHGGHGLRVRRRAR